MFSIIDGYFPRDASNTSPPKGRDTQKCLQTLQNDPQFGNTDPVYSEVAEIRGRRKAQEPSGRERQGSSWSFSGAERAKMGAELAKGDSVLEQQQSKVKQMSEMTTIRRRG